MEQEVLSKIKFTILKTSLTESDVDHLMTLIRKQLEHMNKADEVKFALLRLFCNWSKHIKIERSSVACAIILKLNKALFEIKDSGNTNKVISKISSVISFPKLQNQLKIFLNKCNLPSDLVTDVDKWRLFVNNLINIIVNCPLILPDTRKSEVINTLKKGVVASQLSLTWINQEVFEPTILTNYQAKKLKKEPIKVLILHILMSDTTHILVPYSITWKNKI